MEASITIESPKIPSKPLACYPGKKPYGIKDNPSDSCTPETVLIQYRQSAKKYDKQCRKTTSADEEKCRIMEYQLPVNIYLLGTLAKGPLLPIIPSLSKGPIDDFRSMEVFYEASKNPSIKMIADKNNGHLRILYPGSGSHMGPLGLAMKGIEEGTISSSEITYTEIDETAEKRIKEYLVWLANPDHPIICNLSEQTRNLADGHDTIYRFKFNGKDIKFVFTLNGGGELWAQEEVIKKSNLIIFHDSIYGTQAERFIEKLKELSRNDKKTRLVLTENQQTSKEKGHKAFCEITGSYVEIQSLHGFYGCSGSYISKPPNFVVKDGKLMADFSGIIRRSVLEEKAHSMRIWEALKRAGYISELNNGNGKIRGRFKVA